MARNCPNCNHPIPPGNRSLCPNCHYPLILETKEDSLGATAGEGLHKPTESRRRDDTSFLAATRPAQVRPPAAPVGGITCPSCGHNNPARQQRCEQCAYMLVETPVFVAPAPPPTPRRKSRAPIIALVVAGSLVVAGGLGYGAYRFMSPSAGTGIPIIAASPTSPQVPANLIKVPRRDIRSAKASSTLPNDGGTSYSIKNTLDGDKSTAWNSNGSQLDENEHITLTFRFEEPLRLYKIAIRNGYQRDEQVFSRNRRVSELFITTDALEQPFQLEDTLGVQPLVFDFGETAEVILTLTDFYSDEGTVHRDVAISDIVFYYAP